MNIKQLSLFLGSLLLLFSACTKISDTYIGTDLVPAVDGVNTLEAFVNVFTKNAGTDTIRPTLTDNHVVGHINDPLFGTTDASINFQVSLPSTNFKFESNANQFTLDSVVLVLSYAGVWGDSMAAVPLYVKELAPDQPFLPDTVSSTFDAFTGYVPVYNTTSEFATAGVLSKNVTNVFPTRLGDSVYVFKDSGINMIRIPLADDFGNRLLNYDSTVYKSDSAFRTNLKGLHVYSDESSNTLLKIALRGANTKLAVYYQYHPLDSADGVLEHNVRYFGVNGTSAHSNHIVRDRSTGQIQAYLPSNPDTKNDDLIFIQGGPGTFASVKIDSSVLGAMPNYIVHRAELLMEKADDPSDALFAPPNLFLLATDDTSRFVIPGFDTANVNTADAVFTSSYLANYGSYGGVPKKNLGNNSLYTFDITRYVQGVLTNKNRQHPFVLYAPFNEPFKMYQNVPYTASRGYVSTAATNTAGCGRVRLYGGDSTLNNTHRMRVRIVYSIPH